jgi:phage shock protein PspC (stress-responsive transcriptional regulator)
MKRLYRSSKNKVLFGVCGGLGDYFGIDPVIVRLICIFSGIGLIAYFIAAILIPLEPNQ